MDFFDREARAQQQTRLLLWLFGLAVLAVVMLAYLVFALLAHVFERSIFFEHLSNIQLFCYSTIATLILIAGGCYYKMRLLSGGGSAVAEMLGGRKIDDDPSDLNEKKLCDVVAEMAIASGMSVPEIYVLDCERGINSFAAGHTRDDVAIGVTFGAMKLLTRDELQGVIAHEFSHVLNGDTRLNMRLMGLAHGLFWPTIVGRQLLYASVQLTSDDDLFDESRPQVILPLIPVALLFLLLGAIGLPFVRVLKCAICRQREWL